MLRTFNMCILKEILSKEAKIYQNKELDHVLIFVSTLSMSIDQLTFF